MQKFFAKLKAVDEVILSLKETPEQWVITEFSATNKTTNSYIWYSNKEYGLTFIHRDVVYCNDVTHFSSGLGWLVPWRRKLVAETILAASKQGITPFTG